MPHVRQSQGVEALVESLLQEAYGFQPLQILDSPPREVLIAALFEIADYALPIANMLVILSMSVKDVIAGLLRWWAGPTLQTRLL